MSPLKPLCRSGVAGLTAFLMLYLPVVGDIARATPASKAPESTTKTPAPSQPAKPAALPSPETATLGIYLIDIRDLSPAKGTFTCDFWIWSQSLAAENVLSELQFVNAEKVVWYAEGKPEVKGMNCFKRRGTGVFRMAWNLRHYPYDSQILPIQMEYTLRDVAKMKLMPDASNSGVSSKNIPTGWKMTGFELQPDTVAYTSNLGDPNLGNAKGEFSRLTAIIDLSRFDTAEYWTLVSSAYVAVVMMLVSYFMEIDKPASRFALLGASLFASVISLRSALAGLGNFGTLADQFHFIVIGYIIFSLGVTITLSHLFHRGADEKKLRIASISVAVVVAVSFACLNLFLVNHHPTG
jgi:hypothetical protein